MAAFIKKLFKNKKTDNVPKPMDVSRLDPANAKDLDTLIQAARHGETNAVRTAAIEQINHIRHLIPLYTEASANMRSRLAQRISDLSQAEPQQVNEALEALKDPQQQALVRQLCQGQDESAQQVSADTEPKQLLRLAIEGKTAAVRLAAAERIEKEEDLQAVQKAAKGRDKGVYQAARKKLQSLRQAQEKAASVQASIGDLIQQMEEQARTENMQLYGARVESLQSQWKNVAGDASPEQQTAFLSALDTCRRRIHEAERASAQEAESQQKAEERTATLELLRSTLNTLAAEVPERGPSLSSLDALQKTQENRWMEATRDTDVGKAEQKEYQALMLELRNYIGAVQRLSAQQETMVRLAEAETPDTGELKQTLNAVDWPEGYAQPEQLESLTRKLGQEKQLQKAQSSDQKAQQKVLDDLLDRLARSLEQNLFSESRQLHKQAQHAFNGLDHKHSQARQARLTLLGRQLQELEDWRGFATRPKQEELCQAMEYLAEQHIEPEAKAARIKELQQEWRDLGGSSDQSLWHRFKAASDAAYEPCQAYFAAKSELKEANLEKRKAICDQLAEFANNADWSTVDWKAVERIHRVAREEWRSAWPVDFKANRGLQKTFDHLLKQIEAPLNEERRRNEALKQSIVERAEALIEHEPLNEAMEQAKELQKEWEAVGLTRHREDRKLWQAFRAACDTIFGRRDAQRAEQAAEDHAAVEQLQQAISASETVRTDGDVGVEQLQAQLRQLNQTPVPRKLPRAVSDALDHEKHALKSHIQKALRQKRAADWQARINRSLAETDAANTDVVPGDLPSPREIAVRLEIATGSSSPDEDQELRMKQQVERLAAGMGGATTNTEDEIERLVTCWCSQSIPTSEAEVLIPRLHRALEHWRG
ncbi:hypothetical protein RE428_29320 [Marinobacter nanhaiticus D15-8W]|uniref:DUF349 domain-containing protein n=1 Tax=Marinobacter nanhaiticus D15-8W TaxID=626887 RepID=N6X7G0_9GAMM|nr:DUF349 domain-containing protein [Marinobacter nanhaiticus]ENO17088.1 DUF349 domain-containing protein [Marinobacter nanhaiticus D15-8W]BES71914.1 hypothetical protein RE428_29320 [Marinobacter nanhaiticus D15-8W]